MDLEMTHENVNGIGEMRLLPHNIHLNEYNIIRTHTCEWQTPTQTHLAMYKTCNDEKGASFKQNGRETKQNQTKKKEKKKTIEEENNH